MSKNAVCYTLILICLFTDACLAKYSGGNGTAEFPYLIATPNDLNAIGTDSNDFDKHFKMIADVNLASYTDTQFNIIGPNTSTPFRGVFDGNRYCVSNLKLDVNTSMVGLFGYIGFNGIVQNIYLEKVNIKGSSSVGGIAGRNEGIIRNCHVFGTIEGEYDCGGIMGYCFTSQQIQNCSFIGHVHGIRATGGIVGSTDFPKIVNCFAIAEISGESHCGGIVGTNSGGNFQLCFSKGNITCSQHIAGGFVGATGDHCSFGGNIRDCYADVIVNCSDHAGGFSGSPPGEGEIRNCYSSGRVVYDANNYTNIGGFIGCDIFHLFQVFDSYFLETVGPDNNYGEPLSKDQMKKRSTFADAGWDMVNVWDIGEGQTYPFLRTHLPSDINKDDDTNFLDLAIQAAQWLLEK